MSGLASPNNQRKQSNASVDLSEQSTPRGTKREHEDDEELDSGEDETGSKSEKRAGRRKIKIEYIDDKSRRHITFSKRKAGIMKKAYELSTLTGTQVLLLVVSETGLVYTFTTPKLQPLVTKPEGKNLIQACLNAPDTPSGQDSPNTTRSAQNSSVYGNDNSPSVDNNNSNDAYDSDRKPQTPGNQMSQPQPYTLGLNPYNQYSGIANGMTLSTSGIAAPPYMSTGYPQYNQQAHLNQYAAPSNAYMPSTGYWPASATNGTKVPQYPNQSPEKK
ncbi:609_t:CDS:2 [Acaulospora colombiana]|uniref:609_t:CDS:1 n=1 Tax=Acaulospora colombiana TaxID=27376 RepID=A0ACA9K3J0_9GLOM|nr:609_t:CDS:2 [Acaulospora colombiana]